MFFVAFLKCLLIEFFLNNPTSTQENSFLHLCSILNVFENGKFIIFSKGYCVREMVYIQVFMRSFLVCVTLVGKTSDSNCKLLEVKRNCTVNFVIDAFLESTDHFS